MIRTAVLALAVCVSVVSGAAAIAVVVSQAAFGLLSSAVEAVTGGRSVRNDLAREFEAERGRTASARGDLDAERIRSADLDAKLQATTADRDRLRDRIEKEVAANHVTYRGERKLVREAVADTTDRVSSRLVNSTLRNVGSAAGESLPFVGVGVVAAATAYELYDACEMIRELHELDVAFNPDHAIDEREVCGMRAPTSDELWASVTSSPSVVWEQAKGYYDGLPGLDVSETFDSSYRSMMDLFDWPWGASEATGEVTSP